MFAVGAGVVTTMGAAGAYLLRGSSNAESPGEDAKDAALNDDEPELIDAPTAKREGRSWKESSGRVSGRDGYVFGDLSRGAIVRVFGKAEGGATDDVAAEAEGDARHTQVQRLVREAVRLYRARGYDGSVNMSHTVAYFNESVSVKVDGSESAPWEKSHKGGKEEEEAAEELAMNMTNEAISSALNEEPVVHASEAAAAQIAKEGHAGLVFNTLLARLERRAQSWQALSGVEGLDPMLTQSAQIGFAIPVIKLGWGVSVSLTVSASSLRRWAEHEAAVAAVQVQ